MKHFEDKYRNYKAHKMSNFIICESVTIDKAATDSQI